MKVSTDEHGINLSWGKPERRAGGANRGWRRIQVATALALLAIGALDMLARAWWAIPFLLLGIGLMVFMATWNTRKIHVLESVARKPDYSLIASMEREVYGEAFHHDGAPAVSAWGRVARTPAERDGMCDCARAHHVP